jgi:iron complex outermembrane receptor protein
VIADKQALNTMEAVKNVSGVQASVGTYYDQYLIRGFKSGYGVTWRNGLQLEGLTGAEDILFTDRVEIVKGPASVLYGRIEPGGFVNVVTKRPQEEFKAEVNEQAGSWGLSRTTFDMTGAVDAEKTVLYRLMGVYDHADSFVDFEHRDNGAAALFLTFRPTSNFEFNTQFEHYQKKQTSPDGLGTIPVTRFQGFYNTPYALPRHFSAGDPGVWNDFPFVVHRTVFAYDWTYKFDEDWKLTNRFHYVINDENQTGFWGTGMSGDGAGIDRAFYNYLFQRRQISTNLDLSGAFETGPLKHKSLVGVDWWTSQADEFGLDSWGSEPLTLNVFAPSYGNITGYLRYLVDNARANALYRHRRRDFGVYVQDHVSFFDDRVHLLLGGRWDKAEFNGSQIYGEWDSSCFPTCTAYPLDHAADKPKISPRAGILFKIDEDTSVYGSYVRSFGANNGAAKDGTIFPPEVGLQWEIGAKKLWLDGRVMTSLTFFDLTKMNVMQPDPTAPGFSRAAGTVKSRGIELDFSGQVTDNLSLIASYTFDSAKIVNDLGNGTAGNRFNSVAPNVGSLWAKWDTAPKASEGFEFGGGVYAMDERWGDNANSWRLPGYVKLDAMGAYRTLIDGHAVKFQLNIKNLTDKRYFEYSDGYGFAYYGMPRTFIGSVNFQF